MSFGEAFSQIEISLDSSSSDQTDTVNLSNAGQRSACGQRKDDLTTVARESRQPDMQKTDKQMKSSWFQL
jgi:hypothetical protein